MFLLGAVVIAVALVIVWWLPEEKLRTQSGLQAQQTQAREAAATRSEVPDGAVDAGGAAALVPGAGSTDTPETAREAAEEDRWAPSADSPAPVRGRPGGPPAGGFSC